MGHFIRSSYRDALITSLNKKIQDGLEECLRITLQEIYGKDMSTIKECDRCGIQSSDPVNNPIYQFELIRMNEHGSRAETKCVRDLCRNCILVIVDKMGTRMP